MTLTQMALMAVSINPLLSGLRAEGAPAAVYRGAVFAAVIGVPFLLWFRLVRRQERQIQVDHRPTG